MVFLSDCMCSLVTALAYRNAKAYDKARDTYERAAETYYKNHAYPQIIPTILSSFLYCDHSIANYVYMCILYYCSVLP